MESAQQAAITTRNEAARTLSAGRDARPVGDKVGEIGKPDVASAVATVLDAAVQLLRSVDLQPPAAGGPGHSMQAIAQRMNAGAGLARRTTGNRTLGATHSRQPSRTRRQSGPGATSPSVARRSAPGTGTLERRRPDRRARSREVVGSGGERRQSCLSSDRTGIGHTGPVGSTMQPNDWAGSPAKLARAPLARLDPAAGGPPPTCDPHQGGGGVAPPGRCERRCTVVAARSTTPAAHGREAHPPGAALAVVPFFMCVPTRGSAVAGRAQCMSRRYFVHTPLAVRHRSPARTGESGTPRAA